MARVLFSETSRRWANQLNDLRERWHIRREEPIKHIVPVRLFVQDIKKLSGEDLLNLKTELINTLNECKRELGKAQETAWREGVYMDRGAFNDLFYSVKAMGNHVQEINHLLGKQRREQAKNIGYEQHFIDVCREMLSKEQYLKICDEARNRAGL